MQIVKTLLVGICSLLRCQHEYPSDPLSETTLSAINDRTGRAYGVKDHLPLSNEVDINNEKETSLVVETAGGKIEGYVMKTIRQKPIRAFEGIPYAETTGGSNRFKPAIPKANWTGILMTKAPGNKCLQLHLLQALQLTGHEDCLNLNVYTPFPKKEKHGDIPVLVFIHGGSWYFSAGSEYGPAYLLEHPIIFVTINYRLGIMGFLSTGDDVVSGNLGLKDQSMALLWVQNNIKAFGGDPTRVTIAGQSSGGASVHLHMMSEMSRGKFIRAISLSGTAYNPWAVNNHKFIEHQNRKLSRASRCPRNPSLTFVECLRRKSSRQLAFYLLSLFEFPYFLLPTVPLGAVVEPKVAGAFLTAHPDQLYAEKHVANIPWICSRNLNESQALFSALTPFGLAKENRITRLLWKRMAPLFMDYRFSTSNVDDITRKVAEFYTKNNSFPTKGNIFAELSTDRIFGYPVHKSLQIHSRLAPTYSWVYGYKGRASLLGQLGLDLTPHGVSHSDDLSIYFNMTEFYPGYKTTDPEYAVVKLMTSMIANFVITGEPVFTEQDRPAIKIMDPVNDPRNIRILLVDEEVKMIKEPNTNRYKFWESLNLDDINPFIALD